MPPLVLDLGVRTDPEARALRRAVALYERNRRPPAKRMFERYRSVEAQVGAALSAWPEGFVELQELGGAHPESGAAQLALGLGEFWQGLTGDAQRSWRRAAAAEPDSTYAIRADDFLHPELPVPGLPTFVPSSASPAPLERLRPPQQYAFLRRRAEDGNVRDVLLFGAALQRLGRPVSARREFERAAALAPSDPEALTAVAVGHFDKDRPAEAFSRLGPLTQRFPRAATVRFHLGLLLVWMGQIDDARRQFRLARARGARIDTREAGGRISPKAAGAVGLSGMRVGFVYNVRAGKGHAGSDEDAEFDDPATIAAIRDAIASHGHEVVGLEADATLPAALVAANVDVVFNIAEGQGSRSRESQVPALLDLLGIPFTGSDAVALGVTLDKSVAKAVARAAGVATPLWTVMTAGDEPLPERFRLPAIVKPLHEGSSKGIEADSVVADERRLRERARDVIGRYGQPVLCEEYVAGREITVGLLGSPVRVLPPMEVVFLGDEELPLYSFDVKKRFEELVRYEVPAKLTDERARRSRARQPRCVRRVGLPRRRPARLPARPGR